MRPISTAWCAIAALLACLPAFGGVVLNEIFYHAPDDLDALQWIELHNPDATPVNLSGWRFTKGIEFTFPAGSTLAPGGFLVVCKDPSLFSEFYEVPVIGPFKKSLAKGGDTVELADASGQRVDRVTYGSRAPWPSSADGISSSLERITPGAPGDTMDNWSASPLPEDEERPAGSPGRTNAVYSFHLPPVIRSVEFDPIVPVAGAPVRVKAIVPNPVAGTQVEIRYRIAGPGNPGEERVAPMKSAGADVFTGEIPALQASQLVRVRVRAVDPNKAERYYPSPNLPSPALTLFVPPKAEPGVISRVYVVHTDPAEHTAQESVRLRALRPDPGPFGNSAPRELMELLGGGLDLPSAWFQLTIQQGVDAATYAKLRSVFQEAQAERNRLIGASLAATNVAAETAAAPAKIQAFQTTFTGKIKSVLPAASATTFATWLKAQNEPKEQDFGRMLAGWMNLEGPWFGLNMRVGFTPEQVEALRSAYRAAVEARTATAASASPTEFDFEKIQKRLGEIRSNLDAELRAKLNRRQWHALVDWRNAQASPIRPRLVDLPQRPPRGTSAFVVVSPDSRTVDVFDFIHITERSAGHKVRFHKDHPWNGMTSAAMIFEYNDRFLLAEPLAFDLYRRLGNAACRTDFVRLNQDGHDVGYQLVVEQVNAAFLRQNQLDPSGDFYKILWYGSGVEGQHEKQNHPDRGYKDLVTLIDSLRETSGEAQWEVIRKNFDLNQVATYFAVNLVLSHWDGFFNNYFTYHDRKGDGKWRMFPWDQDKTWGFHDASGDKVFFDMPVTFGMAGDLPPGGGPAKFDPGSWWRPGGYFSAPLLANPEFRKIYLKRVRQILEDTYTEAAYFPVIDAMAARLRPEIPIRAHVIGEDPAVALSRLDKNVASLKEHLVKRRQFLLDQAELKAVPR
ncbi:MAG: CotH kinase family protein [Verrucomicrobiota bacterium]